MKYLTVYFEGLCALHAEKQIKGMCEEDPKSATMLFLDRKNGESAAGIFEAEGKWFKRFLRFFLNKKNNADRRIIDPHHTTLEFFVKDVVRDESSVLRRNQSGVKRPVVYYSNELKNGEILNPRGFFRIQKEEVSVELDTSSEELCFGEHIDLLARMEEAVEGSGRIKGSPSKLLEDGLLSGLIGLDVGRLSVARDSDVDWRFEPVEGASSGGGSDYLPRAVVLSWRVEMKSDEANRVKFVFKSVEDGGESELVLESHEGICVHIKNRELDYSLGLNSVDHKLLACDPARDIDDSGYSDYVSSLGSARAFALNSRLRVPEPFAPDVDFESFYAISEDPDPRGGRYVPVPETDGVGDAGAGRPCIPARFDAGSVARNWARNDE